MKNLRGRLFFIFIFILSCNFSNSKKKKILTSILIRSNLGSSSTLTVYKNDTVLYLHNKGKDYKYMNILFQEPELTLNTSENSNIFKLEIINNELILTQEFGNASPEGWYNSYFKVVNNNLFLDSLSVELKNFNAKSEKEFIKKKSKKYFINCTSLNVKNEFKQIRSEIY